MSRRPASGAAAIRPRRLRRELRTVEVMVGMYCRAHHQDVRGEGTLRLGSDHLCPDCSALLDYAGSRVDACRFGEHKPTCARCTVHCFRASERESVRRVMRYAGPRMALRHPYLAARHMLDRHHTPLGV